MSTTLEDVAYDMYLAEIAEEELKFETIAEFKAELLKRYYLKNPLLLKSAKEANNTAIVLYNNKFYTASFIFSFIATEILIKDLIVKPLLHGQMSEDEIAEILLDHFTKSTRDLNKYSKLLTNFAIRYGDIDLRRYKNKNLIDSFEKIKNERNEILHAGKIIDKSKALECGKLAKDYFDVMEAICTKLGLTIDRENWKVAAK